MIIVPIQATVNNGYIIHYHINYDNLASFLTESNCTVNGSHERVYKSKSYKENTSYSPKSVFRRGPVKTFVDTNINATSFDLSASSHPDHVMSKAHDLGEGRRAQVKDRTGV